MQELEKPKLGYKIIKNFFGKKIEIPDNWNYIKYKEALIEVEDPILFHDNKEYKLITVKRRNEGLVLRGTLKGKDILTKDLYSVNVGDFIIAKMQIIHGACGLVPESLSDAKISGSYLRFKSKKMLDLEYLNWFSHTKFFYQQTFVSSVGSNLEKMNFNKKHWLNLPIPLPPINEQRKIVSILSDITSLIQQTQKIIEQTQRLKEGIMQKLLTKGIRHTKFKSFCVGPRYLNTEIPESWDITRLSEIITQPISYGIILHEEDPNGVPMIVSGDIEKADGIKQNLRYIKRDIEKKYKRTRLQGGEILVALVGATIGKLTVAPKWTKGFNVSRHLGVIRLRQEFIPEFYAYLFKLNLYQKKIIIQTVGSAQPVINLKELSNFQVPTPPIVEQEKIVSILSSLDSKIMKLEHSKSNLESIKKGLMQKLLTGQIRVKI